MTDPRLESVRGCTTCSSLEVCSQKHQRAVRLAVVDVCKRLSPETVKQADDVVVPHKQTEWTSDHPSDNLFVPAPVHLTFGVAWREGGSQEGREAERKRKHCSVTEHKHARTIRVAVAGTLQKRDDSKSLLTSSKSTQGRLRRRKCQVRITVPV